MGDGGGEEGLTYVGVERGFQIHCTSIETVSSHNFVFVLYTMASN